MVPVFSPQQTNDSLEMGTPDLSHLSEEERQIILQVLQRQKAEERKEEEIAQKGNLELWDIEKQIQERKENAQKLIGTQDDAICQICQKTKFADGIGHKCFYCQLRSCARCGGKTTSKNKNIWACSLCQKRQQILARTGKWFQQQPHIETHPTPHQLPQKSSDFSISEHTRKTQQEKQLQRKQSLNEQKQQQKRNSLTRQNTLKRQQSIEEKNVQQQTPVCTLNGGGVETSVGAETFKLNGETRKNTKQQQQKEHTNRDSFKQKSINIQQSIEEIVEENNNNKETQNVRTSIQKQSSNKVGNIISRQQSQQHKIHSLQQTSTIQQQQQRPSTSGQMSTVNESSISTSRQQSLDNYVPQTPDPVLSRSPRKIKIEGQMNVNNNTLVPTLPNQNNASSPSFVSSSIRQSLSSSKAAPLMHNNDNLGNVSPLPLLKNRRSKMTINRQQQHQKQMFSSCPSSSDEHLSSPKQRKQQLKQQQISQQGLSLSTSLQLETVKKEEPDFSEKEMLRYIYDNSHPNTRRNTVSTKGSTLPSFGQRNLTPLSSGSMSAINLNASYSNVPLANRIRNYLNNPSVSWKPSTDQRHLIGHLLLNKLPPNDFLTTNFPSTVVHDFGLKVVGCRDPLTGKLGAFVTKVRHGSIADTVGQLRAGDEVLEWNGHQLQNATPETVYTVVQSSKTDNQLELIVSRPLIGDGDDFLNLNRRRLLNNSSLLSHSQSLMGANLSPFISGGGNTSQQAYFSKRVPSPMVLQKQQQQYYCNNDVDPSSSSFTPQLFQFSSDNNSEICGQLEIALLYLSQKKELIISLSRASNLLPRPNGSERNPYIKLFLLPDRSEKSRRQSKVIKDTLCPVWEEHFFYDDLDEVELVNRVLEVTLWDYDAFESHSFLGEVLIDLAQAPLNNQPHLYNLLDMDDDNPIRVRLRYQQRRYSSSMTPPIGQRSRSQMNFPSRIFPHHSSFNPSDLEGGKGRGSKTTNSLSVHDLPLNSSRSRHFGNYFPDFPLHSSEAFWQGRGGKNYYITDEEEEYWNNKSFWDEGINFEKNQKYRNGRSNKNICLSDQEQEWEIGRRRKERDGREHSRDHRKNREHRHHRHGDRQHRDRRPQSATALRNIAEWEIRHSSGGGVNNCHQNFNEEREEKHQNIIQNNKRTTRQQELREQENSGNIPVGGGGYGSDCSVETLSVNSAQSMQNKALLRQQKQNFNQEIPSKINQIYKNEEIIEDYDEDIIIRDVNGQQQLLTISAKEMKDRKKSLMTRLIPGRNGINEANKRLGFARSEEVGIPMEGATVSTTTSTAALAPPEHNRDFIKQNSKESTDSSDNWLPILPDRPLGSFMENLGPGQVVGRQALGSLPIGELLIGLSNEQGTGLILDVKEAKELKLGNRGAPSCYVKAYLMEGRNCIAKAKTQPSRTRSASPSFRQKLIFTENLKNKMLQLTVIGDFGRLERKSFMGVIQIALEELKLGREQIVGWYKLFNSDSLNGSNIPQQQITGGGPLRKESEEVSSVN